MVERLISGSLIEREWASLIGCPFFIPHDPYIIEYIQFKIRHYEHQGY